MTSRDSLVSAIETITLTIHRDYHNEFDCDAGVDDATEDHDGEMALAGQIVTDLWVNGLTIAKARRKTRRPRYTPMRDGVDYDSSEQ